MTSAEIGEKMEELAWKQGQAVDGLCLLLDGLDREGRDVTNMPAATEAFAARLRMYMGALHLIVDAIESNGEALESISEQIAKGMVKA